MTKKGNRTGSRSETPDYRALRGFITAGTEPEMVGTELRTSVNRQEAATSATPVKPIENNPTVLGLAQLINETFSRQSISPEEIQARMIALGALATAQEGYEVDSEGALKVRAELAQTREKVGIAQGLAGELAIHIPHGVINDLSAPAQLYVRHMHPEWTQE